MPARATGHHHEGKAPHDELLAHHHPAFRLEPVPEQALQHVPLGTIAISGHHVKPGENGAEFVQVSIKGSDGSYIGAMGNASRDRSADA